MKMKKGPQHIQSFSKMFNYFDWLCNDENFKSDIRDIQSKFNIPNKRYVPDFKKDKVFGFPEKWPHRNNLHKKRELRGAIASLCKKYFIDSSSWRNIIEGFIFFQGRPGGTDGMIRFRATDQPEMCIIHDFASKKKHITEDSFYPVVIRISPYSSKRDVLEFIEHRYSDSILPIQKKYQNPASKLGRVRNMSGDIRDRNNFIYRLYIQGMRPYTKINAALVKVGFESIDVGLIGKIISMERKRRTEL